MNPLFAIDFYKVGHVSQYPADTEQVWSNWTPRASRIPSVNRVVHFGLQYALARLREDFNREFFSLPISRVTHEYKRVISATLGVSNPRTDHIERLHEKGYLPLKVWAIPEGFATPLGVPHFVITNTHHDEFWLPNYLETALSNVMWMPSTSATTAQRYRRLFTRYARVAGETDLAFVDWMGHDFSYRGMAGLEAATLSGMGHLTAFNGTDTIPAILAAKKYYGASLDCGGSVPATEHSVMCAGGQDGEFETFKRLITETYPQGIVSIVSDTWDLWKVLTDFIPRLKSTILEREGKVVIRPDSGDPVKILCGDMAAPHGSPANYGTLALLKKALGTELRPGALPLIRHAGAIYGDSITLERAQAILSRTVDGLSLSPFNLVFGIGSFTYQYTTRDTFGFAMKATAVKRSGRIIPIFKDPVTDDGLKKSLCGIPAVYRTEESTEEHPDYFVQDHATPEQLDDCELVPVFRDGHFLHLNTFNDIRERVRNNA